MRIILRHKLRQHVSLVAMACGVACLLSATTMLYKHIETEHYNQFVLLTTFIGLVFSFGLLGVEQTFVRLSIVNKNEIQVSYQVLNQLIIAIIVSPTVISLICWYYWNVSLFLLYPIAILATVNMFAYNYLRILSKFEISQMVNNVWRYGLIIPTLLSISYTVSFNMIYTVLLLSLLSGSLYSFFYIRNNCNILFFNSSDRVFSLSVSFSFSIAIMTLLSYFDRFFVGANFSEQELSDYFFIYSIYLAPYQFISSYVGFKTLVKFKNRFNLLEMEMMVIKSVLVLAPIIIISTYLSNYFLSMFGLDANYMDLTKLVLVLQVLGGVRIIYSFLSAAMGAIATSHNIWKANVYTFLVFIICILTLNNLASENIIIIPVITLVTIVTRTFFYYIGVREHENLLRD